MRRIALLSVLVFAMAVAYGVWVGGERSAEASEVDAVVVHAGGRGERLDHALELMDSGIAPTLVIMRGTAPTWPQANELCGSTEPYEVVCPLPDPDTTIGEAIALDDLASSRKWGSVVSVTSNYHLRRATFLDAKCSGIDVLGSSAGSDLAPPIYVLRVLKEMAGLVQAALVSC